MPQPAKLGTLALVEAASPDSLVGRLKTPTLRFSALLLPCLFFASACGPSMQSIHEGSVRFEHCYRLDMDPKIAPSHRHACWEQWTRVYSYGQARDRIEYARRRIVELEAGDPSPPRLNLDGSEARPEREFYMSMPAPTDAHASPPPKATAPIEEPPRQQVPGDECIIRCRQKRSSCLTSCEPGKVGTEPKRSEASARESREPGQREVSDQQADSPDADQHGGAGSDDAKCTCEVDYKSCAMRCFE